MDRFFTLVDDLENDDIVQNQPARKKLLTLKFLQGPLLHSQPKEIQLTGERALIFGNKDAGG